MDLKDGVKTTGRRKSAGYGQRRFPKHGRIGKPMVLANDHPAVVEGRSLFSRSANRNDTGKLLKSGLHHRKLGKMVVKGKWRGFPIFSLTLEERATCPRSCKQWADCFGNHMPWAVRYKYGVELMDKLVDELAELQAKYPRGFLIRLHLLGDFPSVEYVSFWSLCLKTFPALHVFGYSARPESDEIGKALRYLTAFNWDRFAIRSSGGVLPGIPKAVVIDNPDERGDAILCPAMHGKDPDARFCGNCSLCWATKKPIAFLRH